MWPLTLKLHRQETYKVLLSFHNNMLSSVKNKSYFTFAPFFFNNGIYPSEKLILKWGKNNKINSSKIGIFSKSEDESMSVNLQLCEHCA